MRVVWQAMIERNWILEVGIELHSGNSIWRIIREVYEGVSWRVSRIF